eukprot:tig00021135_g18948.t1
MQTLTPSTSPSVHKPRRGAVRRGTALQLAGRPLALLALLALRGAALAVVADAADHLPSGTDLNPPDHVHRPWSRAPVTLEIGLAVPYSEFAEAFPSSDLRRAERVLSRELEAVLGTGFSWEVLRIVRSKPDPNAPPQDGTEVDVALEPSFFAGARAALLRTQSLAGAPLLFARCGSTEACGESAALTPKAAGGGEPADDASAVRRVIMGAAIGAGIGACIAVFFAYHRRQHRLALQRVMGAAAHMPAARLAVAHALARHSLERALDSSPRSPPGPAAVLPPCPSGKRRQEPHPHPPPLWGLDRARAQLVTGPDGHAMHMLALVASATNRPSAAPSPSRHAGGEEGGSVAEPPSSPAAEPAQACTWLEVASLPGSPDCAPAGPRPARPRPSRGAATRLSPRRPPAGCTGTSRR